MYMCTPTHFIRQKKTCMVALCAKGQYKHNNNNNTNLRQINWKNRPFL